MNNQSNLKRSCIEMADAADHLSSPINHFHSSSSNDMVEPQTAMADDACIQPQPQLQQQQQQQHIALPPLVEDLLNQLCNERKQPQPDYNVRRRLGLLGEEKALQLLHEINEAKVIKTLSGFIMWMIRNKPQYQCPSPSPSPSKYCPASLLQTQLSASPFTPSVRKEQPGRDHGGLRPRYSYSSASPSKALRVSPYQGPSYAPPSTITPVQLFKDTLPLPLPFTQDFIFFFTLSISCFSFIVINYPSIAQTRKDIMSLFESACVGETLTNSSVLVMNVFITFTLMKYTQLALLNVYFCFPLFGRSGQRKELLIILLLSVGRATTTTTTTKT
ncbi:hypothetical protein PRUPE_7G221300 [Prunus persica]|uniref:RDRP3-5 N-terminal domain-containing protein n=1 Tax=Prunus persica TaxID=3760 RepID=A0A251NF57_PRUPE|nr:uncharacterized protein LOC109950260 [Prunus persica]ONH97968.1 hypothetical protein PRUPE_7G221300 [Prunus persica]